MTAQQFDHFILTRFNVRISGKLERPGDDWLRHRLGHFDDLCLRSISSQTNKTARWLVFFDEERSPWFEGEVLKRARDYFEPVWVKGSFSPLTAARAVAARSNAPWLITTGIDNDDAIARDFIETVQSRFNRQDFEFINFQAGIQLSVGGLVYRSSNPSSPFLSLIERRTEADPRTVYLDWHVRVERYGVVKQIFTHPMWIQMIHGENVENSITGIRADPQILTPYFDIGKYVSPPVSRFHLLAWQLVTTCRLSFRVIRSKKRTVVLLKLVRSRLQLMSRRAE